MIDTGTIATSCVWLVLGLLAAAVLEVAFALFMGRLLAGPRRPLSPTIPASGYDRMVQHIPGPQEAAQQRDDEVAEEQYEH